MRASRPHIRHSLKRISDPYMARSVTHSHTSMIDLRYHHRLSLSCSATVRLTRGTQAIGRMGEHSKILVEKPSRARGGVKRIGVSPIWRSEFNESAIPTGKRRSTVDCRGGRQTCAPPATHTVSKRFRLHPVIRTQQALMQISALLLIRDSDLLINVHIPVVLRHLLTWRRRQ